MAVQTGTATIEQYLQYELQLGCFEYSPTQVVSISRRNAPESLRYYCVILKNNNPKQYKSANCKNYMQEIDNFFAARTPTGKLMASKEPDHNKFKSNYGDQTKCVKYNRKTGKWDNGCGVSVLIGYDTGSCKSFGGRGTAGPVKARSSGAYNPLLKQCNIKHKACDYKAWAKGTCSVR